MGDGGPWWLQAYLPAQREAMEGLAPDDVTWLRERVVERLLTELSDELREALVLARCATPAEAPELLLDAGPPGR